MNEHSTPPATGANQPLLQQLMRLIAAHQPAFGQQRVFYRAAGLVLGQLLSLGRHTITQSLVVLGLVNDDWTAFYDLFGVPRFNRETLRTILIRETIAETPLDSPYVVIPDGVHILRHSRTMPGTSWARHPQTPAWKPGITRAQRFVDIAWLTPANAEGSRRAIPLGWEVACPEKAVRPEGMLPKKEWEVLLDELRDLRTLLDAEGREQTLLLAVGDGAYSCQGVWAGLPERTAVLARCARNRALFALPTPEPRRRGAPRKYGPQAPTPAAHLDKRAGWEHTVLTVRGRQIPVTYRVAGPYVVRGAHQQPLYLLVVKGIRRKVNGKEWQRDAAFWLVSAVQRDGNWVLPLSAPELLEWAWQRWEVEVSHRDLKASFGVGEVQCWGTVSAILAVQFQVWVASLLMLAGYRVWGVGPGPVRPPGRWWAGSRRWSWGRLLQALRQEVWGTAEFQRVWPGIASNWAEKEGWLRMQTNACQGSRRA